MSNTRATAIWIPTRGHLCSLFLITRSGQAVPQDFGFQCVCECPNPGTVMAAAYRKLEPGESIDLPWAAHELSLCAEDFDCTSVGYPRTIDRWVAHDKALAPGPVTATLGFTTELPSACTAVDGTAECTTQPGVGRMPELVAPFCGGSSTVAVDVDVPADGSITVDVPIP